MNKIVRGIIVFIVIVLILVVGVGAMIRFDVFGLGTQIVGPYIKDVPVLNLILPEMPEEEGATEAYNFQTVEEAVEILKLTEKMLKESGEEAEKISEQLTQLTAEVERLKVFEDNQLQFEADKAAFDQAIADAADPVDYKEWFETIYPENAADIYGEVIQDVAVSEDYQGVISIYEAMKPDAAASILEGMATTKLADVTDILKALQPDQSASILSAMDPTTAAKITTFMSPEE